MAEPLDAWLYFLNNASGLDPHHLPATLCHAEIEEAVEVLEMLTHDEIQREMYEAREKARRDAASWQSALEHWKQAAATGWAEGHAQGELIGQIHAFQHVLGQQQTPKDHLTAMSLDELKSLVDQLRSHLNGPENNASRNPV